MVGSADILRTGFADTRDPERRAAMETDSDRFHLDTAGDGHFHSCC